MMIEFMSTDGSSGEGCKFPESPPEPTPFERLASLVRSVSQRHNY